MGITSNGALKRDDNDNPVMGGTSSADNATIINASFDPVTRRLLTDNSGGGTGTVTSVSVVTANGFAGTVATATTTPAITLTTSVTGILSGNGTAISAASTTGSGAVVLANTPTLITPVIGVATGTSLAATGVLSTGTNGGTGGQLTLNGATSGSGVLKVAAAAGAGIVFQLPSANGSNGNVLSTDGAGVTSWAAGPAASLTVGSTAIASGTTTRILYDNAGTLGEYTITGSGTVVAMATAPTFVTSITTPSVLATSNDSGALGASGTAFADLFLASGGVINWAANNANITHSSGILTVGAGEFRITSANVGTNADSVPTLSSTSTFTNKTLTTPTLTTPVINGASTGTGVASAATASTLMQRDSNGNTNINTLFEGFTTTVTAAGTTTLTITATYTQVFTGSSTQTVKLPTTSVPQGAVYQIINQSSGAVTVQSSGANTIVILAGGTNAIFTAVVATPTTAANWSGLYYGDIIASGKSLTVNNTLTLAGTDATTMTFPTTSATIARTDAANTFTGASTASAWVLTSPTITTKISPTSDDGAPLGDTTHNFSDLFLASGAVVNYANSNVVLTHTSGILTLGTGTLKITTPTNTTTSVVTIDGTQTITNKRNQPRTASSTTASTLTPDLSSANVYFRTTQTATLTINAPTGTPVIGEVITIYVDSAGAQTLTIDATYKVFGAAFPAATTAGKTFMMQAQYNGTDWKTTWANAI